VLGSLGALVGTRLGEANRELSGSEVEAGRGGMVPRDLIVRDDLKSLRKRVPLLLTASRTEAGSRCMWDDGRSGSGPETLKMKLLCKAQATGSRWRRPTCDARAAQPEAGSFRSDPTKRTVADSR
jgi:hypothetical protein